MTMMMVIRSDDFFSVANTQPHIKHIEIVCLLFKKINALLLASWGETIQHPRKGKNTRKKCMFVYVRYTHSHTSKQMLFLLTFDCDGDEWVNDGDFDYLFFFFFCTGLVLEKRFAMKKMSGWEEGGNARRKCCIRFDDWWLVKYSDRKIYFYVGVRFHSVFIICQFCENLI